MHGFLRVSGLFVVRDRGEEGSLHQFGMWTQVSAGNDVLQGIWTDKGQREVSL